MRLEARAIVDNKKNLRNLDMNSGPLLVVGTSKKLEETMFGQKWAIAFWDEAQWLRTEGHLSRAAFALRVRSANTVLCSATPLHNGERVSRSLSVLRRIH